MNNNLKRWWETRGFMSEVCRRLPEVLGGRYRGADAANRVLRCGEKAKSGLVSLDRLMESIPGVGYETFGNDALKSIGIGIEKAKRCFVIRDGEKMAYAVGMNLSSILNPGAIGAGVRAVVQAQSGELSVRDISAHTAKMSRCATDALAAWWMLKRMIRCQKTVDSDSGF